MEPSSPHHRLFRESSQVMWKDDPAKLRQTAWQADSSPHVVPPPRLRGLGRALPHKPTVTGRNCSDLTSQESGTATPHDMTQKEHHACKNSHRRR